jgi:hypothetical protein
MMGWRAASAVDARADDDGAKAAVDATAEARTSLDMRAMAAVTMLVAQACKWLELDFSEAKLQWHRKPAAPGGIRSSAQRPFIQFS